MVVGAGPVEGGSARIVATFPMPPATTARIHLRYASDAPWFLPGDACVIEQPLQPPSPWKKVPLALAAIALLTLSVLARIPALRKKSRAAEEPEDEEMGPGVAFVRASSPSEGWSGTVVDAHDGNALRGVRVAIERPGMLGTETIAHAVSDANGSFVLGSLVARPGDELVIEGPFHARLRRPLPKPGVLSVAVLQRKRAVLNDLVDWVKRRGDLFTFKGEPTPAELSSSAALVRRDVSTWADAVESAAYGGRPVDAAVHEEINRLMPVEPEGTHSAVPGEPAEDLHKRLYRRAPPKGPRG